MSPSHHCFTGICIDLCWIFVQTLIRKNGSRVLHIVLINWLKQSYFPLLSCRVILFCGLLQHYILLFRLLDSCQAQAGTQNELFKFVDLRKMIFNQNVKNKLFKHCRSPFPLCTYVEEMWCAISIGCKLCFHVPKFI